MSHRSLAFHHGNLHAGDLEEDVNTWVTELARLDDDDVLMTFSASDIMAGKRFSLTTRNREIISRHKSLAEHMGATVEEIDRGEATELVIGPPLHQ